MQSNVVLSTTRYFTLQVDVVINDIEVAVGIEAFDDVVICSLV